MPVVFLLHGLGGHAWTLWPLQWHLQAHGFPHVHCVSYPVDRLDLDQSVAFVDRAMREHVSFDTPVILVGQSMGGVVANRLHALGWKVLKAIYIGSPLKGARLLRQLNQRLPRCVRNALYKKPYGILLTKPSEKAPPHPYHCITMGWLTSGFDGCVYRDEATLDPQHHTHLRFADHRTVFANPRLWRVVTKQLRGLTE